MTSNRKTAVLVGVLFIIGTVSGIFSALLTGPILQTPDYLAKAAANPNQLVLGALMVLVMGFALAMIPALLYPLFKRQNEALALGAIIFRSTLEPVAYIAIVICWLLLLSLSVEYAQAGSPADSYFQTLGVLLQKAADWNTQILAIVFSLGALMIYALFYQSRLIPRWLAVWGLVGGVLYLAAPLLDLFGLEMGILMAPLALQEMVLALWLIVKGFDAPENASVTTK